MTTCQLIFSSKAMGSKAHFYCYSVIFNTSLIKLDFHQTIHGGRKGHLTSIEEKNTSLQ